MKIAISICVPSRERRFDNWGDKYYARSLKHAFKQISLNADILYMNEWEKASNYDVLINIRGLKPLIPSQKIPLKILWQINHPELNTKEEMSSYDKLYIASKKYKELLSSQEIIAEYLPQAGDEINFKEQNTEKKYDILFVGNNHNAQAGKTRKIINDLLNNDIDFNLKIVGAMWHGLVPQRYILQEFVEWKDLPELYSSACIVLNDHQKTMSDYGFINNRCFDLALLNQFQISDYVDGMEDFNIITYSDSKDLYDKIDFYLNNSDELKRNAKITRLLSQKETFQNRATLIGDYIKEVFS